MSRVTWHRPARIPVPALPSDRLTVALPPAADTQSNSSALLSMLLPLMSSVSIAAYLIAYHNKLTIFLAVGILTLSVGVTFAVRHQMRSATRKQKQGRADRYAAHVADVKQAAVAMAETQRAIAVWQWPSPERLWAIARRRRRVWERRPADPDFLRVRLGLGRGELATPLVLSASGDPTMEYDPDLMANASRVVATFGEVGKQPVLVDLGRAGVVSLVGPVEATRGACRALVCQVAVLHAPDDVTVMVSADGDDQAWEWASWLPHARDPRSHDPAMPSLVASGYTGLADAVEREVRQAHGAGAERRPPVSGDRDGARKRHTVIVVDGFRPNSPWAREPLARHLVEIAGPRTGLTVVALVQDTADEPSRVDARVRLDGRGHIEVEAADPAMVGVVAGGTADQPPIELCEATARAIAPLILTEENEAVLARAVPLAELLGIGDPANFDPEDLWASPGDERVLSASIGVASDGREVVLDLKEAAQGGMGPHGLIVGATGSGKSELLRTLLTGLAMSHSPDLLSLVLVDFKGGATFAGMTGLPHVAGLITNLADDLALVDRVRDALVGEQQRRQRMLRDAGNVDSLRQYQARQAAGGLDAQGRPLEPLPYLLVIVDEFGELLSLRPDFIDLFVQIGRVGRSLGIHLLLATQRLEEGRLRGLESHLSYRICLRTFSPGESRAVIGTTDAYQLPQLPGSGYLKVAESVYERVRVAHVSAPYVQPNPARVPESVPVAPVVLRPRQPVDEGETAEAADDPPALALVDGPTQMEVIVDRLVSSGQPVHQVWLEPLPPAVALDTLLGPVGVEDDRGLQAEMWLDRGGLRIPVGVTDLPLRQEQQALVLDFARQEPHLLVVGASQSGKSTFLRTLMLSGMLTHTPREMWFYGIDYGGGALHTLAGAPHVSGVAARGETERTSRVFSEARRLISDRAQLFRELGVGSMEDFRRLRDSGQLPSGVPAADAFVIIDNWGVLRAEFPDADEYVADIAANGPGVGVHLIMTANRWGDVRANVRDALGGRIELRLNDPGESEVDRKVAKLLQAGTPGRGITRPGLFYQTALPRLDGEDTVVGLREAQDEMVGKIAGEWQGPVAPPVRLLPEAIHVAEIPAGRQAVEERGVVVAIGERDLGPVRLDLTADDQHCLVIGDSGAGKSSFLRTWMRGLAARQTAGELRFMVVDYRHALMKVVPDSFVGAYAGDANAAGEYASQLAATLGKRLPPHDISPRELRRRSWWSGPELYLVIDDYDMAAANAGASPLRPLIDLLPYGCEIGFHVMLARRSGGFGRVVMTDPLISRVRELGAAGLMLSSDPREGALLGARRGAERPPGRGVLVRKRHDDELVQVLISDTDADEEGELD